MLLLYPVICTLAYATLAVAYLSSGASAAHKDSSLLDFIQSSQLAGQPAQPEFLARAEPIEIIDVFVDLGGAGKPTVRALTALGELRSWDLKQVKAGSVVSSTATRSITAGEIEQVSRLPRQQVNASAKDTKAITEELFALARKDGSILIWSAEAGSIAELPSNRAVPTRILSLNLQPDGKALLIAGADGRIYRWLFAEEKERTRKGSQKPIERYLGLSSVASVVVFHPHGRIFVSGDWSGQLFVWKRHDKDRFEGEYDQDYLRGRFFTEAATRRSSGRGGDSQIQQLIFTPDGEYLLVTLANGMVEWWQVRGFPIRASIQAHLGLIYSAAMSSSGERVATVGRDGVIKIYMVPATSKGVTSGAEEPYPIFTELLATPALGARFLVFLAEDKIAAVTATGELRVIDVPELPVATLTATVAANGIN